MLTRGKEDQERLLVGGTVDFKLQAWPPPAAAGGWLEGRQPQGPLLARRRRRSSLPLVSPSLSSALLLAWGRICCVFLSWRLWFELR